MNPSSTCRRWLLNTRLYAVDSIATPSPRRPGKARICAGRRAGGLSPRGRPRGRRRPAARHPAARRRPDPPRAPRGCSCRDLGQCRPEGLAQGRGRAARAPRLGASSGPAAPARSSPRSVTALPTVAPTTIPTLPSRPDAAAARCRARPLPHGCRDARPVADRVLHRRALGVGGQGQHEQAPPRRGGEVERRSQRLVAEVGADRDGVGPQRRPLGEAALGVPGHRRCRCRRA